MITFLLYNCGIELLESLPLKLVNHPAIRNDLKRRKKKSSEVLLDQAVHQSALNSKEQANRGRIDIVHHCILQFLFSHLIHPSGLYKNIPPPKLFIHSINNTFFEVLPSWRPPSHFLRFRGLLEKLYSKKELIISSDQKIQLKNGSISEIINSLQPKNVLVFTSTGKEEELNLHSFSKLLTPFSHEPNVTLCLIGGYQHGAPPQSLLSDLSKTKAKVISVTLEGGRLPSWKVLSIALHSIAWELDSFDNSK